MDEWESRLFKYNYTSYCQGTADRGVGYALLNVPRSTTFNNNRSVLMNSRHNDNHEIDIESVEDLTIHF